MHIIVSNAALTELGVSGVTPGWLTAWLLSTGKKRVSFHHLHNDSWQGLSGSQLVIGEVPELMPVAMSHGKRIGANNQGELKIIGAECDSLSNPERVFWYYRHQGQMVVLMPVGDLVTQRDVWLRYFNDSETFLPVHVTTNPACATSRKIALEAGLYAHVDDSHGHHEALDATISYLNHQGIMPECQLLQVLSHRGWRLNVAESCTAGGLAARLARVPGASAVLNGGWITYSNRMKEHQLGVSPALLAEHGAVSEAVVLAMAEAAMEARTMAIAVSGIAGPDGGSAEKPVGTVWAAIAAPSMQARAFKLELSGSRSSIQSQAIVHVLAEACIRLHAGILTNS